MELLRIWQVIAHRKKVILVIFSTILATTIIITSIVIPSYEAKAKILMESSDSLLSLMSTLGLKGGAGGSSSQDETFDTDIALATSRPLLEKFISTLNLRDRKGEILKAEDLIESSMTRKLFPQPYLEVSQYKDSDMLEITSISANPEEAATMANELAKLFIEDKLEQTSREYKKARLFIENQMNDIKEKYFNSLLARKDFMIEEKTVDLQVETGKKLENISELQKEAKKNGIAIAQAIETIEIIQKKIGGRGYVSTEIINALESKLTDLLVDISGKAIDITEEHPDITQLNKNVDMVRKIIADKTEAAFGDQEIPIAPVYAELVKSLKNAYINKGVAKTKEALLKQYIEEAQDDLMKIPPRDMRISEIQLSLTINRDIYQNLLTYQTQVGIAESVTLSTIRLVEPAAIPDVDRPDFPKKTLNYILGVFLGLFGGLSLAFFMEYLDSTIKDSADLKNHGLKFLGSVPISPQKPLLSKVDPNDLIYDAYRTILSNIHFAKLDVPPKRLLITSINQEEGNSTILANLGILYAKENNKVILVDTDLRKPSIHKLFNLPNNEGLTNLLLGNAEMERVILKSGIDGLSVLPSGPTPPDTNLLIKSNEMKELVSKLEEKYDILIFDSAPLLIRNDAVLMSHLADMIIVLRNGVTTHSAVSRANEILENTRITPIGSILNYT